MLPIATPAAVLLARDRSRRRRKLLLWLVVPLLGWMLAVGALAWRQESLLFHPLPLPAAHRFMTGGDVHELTIPVDGAQLSALHLRQPAAKGVVFYLHGNGGNLDTWFTNLDFWRRAGFDLFMIDYRGYGKSSGRIAGEAQLHADVRAAWQRVAAEYAVRRKVIYGRSLGSGLAARLAADAQADLLVLVSPYQSVVQVAAEQYPWVPAPLLRYPLRTDAWLPQVQMPVLILHGDGDTMIPPAHADRLAALSRHAMLVHLPGYGHADVHEAPGYLHALSQQLSAL